MGVLGGSVDFTGAPYYAGMAALRVGAELLYLFTAAEAAVPIKTYSPELMVSTVYNYGLISQPSTREEEKARLVAQLREALPRLHCLCIGPGLSRDAAVLDAVAVVIEEARKQGLPLVIDADGLWLVTERPELVRGYTGVVLTPNGVEYKRLAKAILGDEAASMPALCKALDGPVVLQKGAVDRICSPDTVEPIEVNEEGAPKRPGGLGDILSGSLAAVLSWTTVKGGSSQEACRAAAFLVRRACAAAFKKHKRSMVAPDVLAELGPCFEALCPASPDLGRAVGFSIPGDNALGF